MNREGVNAPCRAFSLEDGVKRAAGERRATGVRATRLEHRTDLRTGGVRGHRRQREGPPLEGPPHWREPRIHLAD